MSKLIVYLNDGTIEEFTICKTPGYGPRWDYRLTPEALHISQGDVRTSFPLTSIRRWEVRS